MIRVTDAIILASTKLHTHRVRTFITVLLSSILFSSLIASVIIYDGTAKSITAFNDRGLNSRYLVLAQTDPPFAGGVLGSNEFITIAKQKGEELIEAKKAEAKRLDVDYNIRNEPSVVITQALPGQNPTERVNMQSYAFTEALREYIKKHPAPGLNDLKRSATSHNPIGFYSSTDIGIFGGSIMTMPNGKENFTPSDNESVDLDFFHNTSLTIGDSKLTQPFELPNVTPQRLNIPLIVSYSTAEYLLKLQQLPSQASSKQRYDRIQQLYSDVSSKDITVTTCYRNTVSLQQIELAKSQSDEIAKNINNKEYQKPSLIYGLPEANTCGQAIVISDTRTDAEKKTQVAQDQFSSDFGQVVTPIQQKLTFQVIGLSPSESSTGKTTFSSLLSNIVGSSLTNGANVIPSDLLEQMPNASVIKSILMPSMGNPFSAPRPNYYVEFANADDARSFISEKSCTTRMDGTCSSPDRLFQLTISENNSIALQDLLQKTIHTISIAALVIIGLAVIIMTSMVGRTISDSRRETAVFRALGAKRGDITIIYAIYTISLTLFIIVLSLLIGLAVAYGFNAYYSQEATLQARLLFDSVNSNMLFSFYSINISHLSMVIEAILITGILSAIIPLMRNIRRNPIHDMREE